MHWKCPAPDTAAAASAASLAEADDETIANWPVPDPDDFDYDGLLEKCKAYGHKAVYFGHPGISDVMNNTGMIRGMENIYMDLALETESVMTLLDRRMKAELAMFERALDKCRDYVDFIWTGEDLGTQRAPLISLDMFRAQIRPRHQPLIDLASSYGKPVMIHCCGSSSWAFSTNSSPWSKFHKLRHPRRPRTGSRPAARSKTARAVAVLPGHTAAAHAPFQTDGRRRFAITA